MQPVTLRTKRLVLSIPTPDDVDAMYEACQDADIQRYTPVPAPYEREHAENFVAQIPKDWSAGVHLTWGIHENGPLVGTIGIYRIGSRQGELGYWLAPGARGRGLLTEAAATVLEWGFSPDALDLERFEWRAVVGNETSARIAQRLGFRYEGTLRQALVSPRGRDDGWIAGLLRTDDRAPQTWPVSG
ncbi:RimJ/RimL family protein N-acetyltransferase [Microbacterium terrae]|uniref:Ribosomal N-acetyltransferase YdaF n=1 Tax=Microbacterium terrae TaxID=69369 RepID=A0A0M2H4M8_9MICO|nr:GNAT family N-acetyltransferase [Microbacterium terrae]KJL39443.1 putative ribosomal N-acetyltransferase YdaF [Microbacterium terrae]MBP1078035.1 RimJ/RimL family protein N-acetyltransferase [Microbacterium terrae]GLK00204.1 N-acetyltransferase [Microbacterium terrae]